MRPAIPRAARFASVDKDTAQRVATRLMSKLRVEGECWVWTGSSYSNGYGTICVNGTAESTHAVAMFLRHGAAAMAADTVNHLCFNRLCCNPDHLQFASNRENLLHGNGASAQHAAKTHCPHGHDYSPDNTVICANGARACLECRRAYDRARGPVRRQKLKLKRLQVST